MRKILTIAAALVAAALIATPTMDANADVTLGKGAIRAATQNFTPIEKPENVACFGWGRCRPGWHMYCGPRRCRCVRC